MRARALVVAVLALIASDSSASDASSETPSSESSSSAKPSDDAADGDGADEDDERLSDDRNPWVTGPEAPSSDDDEARRAMPPRARAASPWDITTPPRMPAPTLPVVDDGLGAREPGPRMETTFERERLLSLGDLALADALVSMPGLWMNEDAAFGFHPSTRGLDETHLAVTQDGIPLLPSFAFPGFPVLSHVALDDVERVTLRHGGRAGLGVFGAAGGVLDIETLPRARDFGEELPLTGEVRAGMGGADLEKQAAARGDVGFGRARVGVSGSVFHREDRRQGRGDGLVSSTEGFGGHLAARGDILVDERTRVFALWRSSRQARTPLPTRCVPDELGRRSDCVTNHDRAIDLLGAGLDLRRAPLGLTLDVRGRAHAQRVSEEWERTGQRLAFAERSKDELWRAGGLVEARLTLAAIPVVIDALRPWLTVGGEVLRDRVTSRAGVRSQRFLDGAAPGEFITGTDDAPLVDGEGTTAKVMGGVGLDGRHVDVSLIVDAGAQLLGISGSDPRLARGIGGRELTPFLDVELGARARPIDEAAVFMGAWRVERAETLFDRTRGRLVFSDEPTPLPMLPGHGRFTEHGAELGLGLAWAFVDVTAQTYVAERDGPIVIGVDATEALDGGAAPARFVRGPRRLVGGVEGTARVRPFFDGLSFEATLGAVAVDEGLFYSGTGLFTPRPASGVVNPAGALLLRYAPPAWPVELFARTRYALPHARLSPDEEQDPVLCPEGGGPTPSACRGALGYALVDAGVSLTPSPHLRIDAVGMNLFDQSHRLRTSTLPGKGIGARLTATLRY